MKVPAKKIRLRCDACGKFRKETDLVLIGGEYDEEWIECIDCISASGFKRHFPRRKR